MEIVFLRHGHALSVEDSGGTGDRDRTLSDRGRAEIQASLKRLAELGFSPAAIIASPFKRAAETAGLASDFFSCANVITLDDLASPIGLEPLLERLIEAAGSAEKTLVVGHQPTLGALSARIAGGFAYDLATAGFAYIRMKDPAAGKGELVELFPH